MFKLGIIITFIGISVVYLSLIILFFCMKLFVFFLQRSKTRVQKKHGSHQISTLKEQGQISGDIVTAITLAIHQSRQDVHDLDKTIITLSRITRPYSPWSSKIHGIRRFVR